MLKSLRFLIGIIIFPIIAFRHHLKKDYFHRRATISRPKIFVVEDDESIIAIIETVLTSRDYEIISTTTTDDVMSTAIEEKPDVSVLDVNLPGEKNGFELCYQLKNHPKTANMPVMILTSTTQKTTESDEEWREKSNADDFITKPFQSADFANRIEQLVEQAWHQKEQPRFDL